MEVSQLHPRQKKKAARVLAAAFFDYPVFTFYFPDVKRRTRYLAWYLGCTLNCALRYGEVFTTADVSGVLFTLPPGHTHLSTWEFIQNGFLLAPFILGRNYARSMDCEDYLKTTQEAVMKARKHYYLWGLAAAPAVQQKGVGSALIERLTVKADSERMPIYLETHNEKNVAYYEKMGFRLVSTDTIPKHNLEFWCMVREPSLT